MKKNSTPKKTLLTEVREELGIKTIKNAKHFATVLSKIRIPVDTNHHVGLILSIHTCELPPKSRIYLNEENTEYGWFSPQEAARKLAFKYPKVFTDVVKKLSKQPL